MLLFYFFAVLLTWQGIVSLYGGWRYYTFVRGEMHKEKLRWTPFASVIVPCKGLDQGLPENLRALFEQDYPAYEIVFVIDSVDDPARGVIESVRAGFAEQASAVQTRVIVAGQARECGQKIYNLCAGVRAVDSSSDVLIFVDTDARTHSEWLVTLVAPLGDERIGATTGYRWFIPLTGGFASRLRAVWNASIASALGENLARNFCWGGATAIRRATFDRLDITSTWQGAVSDDFALTGALRRAKLPIQFVPECLTASLEDCTFPELLEFTTRQMKITRVYAAHLWRIVLFTNLFFVLVFFGGLGLGVGRAINGFSYVAPLAFVACVYALGIGKAFLRWRAVMLSLAAYRAELRRDLKTHLFMWPLASVLYLYNAIAALLSRRIEWRGIKYELKSPTETVIIKQAF